MGVTCDSIRAGAMALIALRLGSADPSPPRRPPPRRTRRRRARRRPRPPRPKQAPPPRPPSPQPRPRRRRTAPRPRSTRKWPRRSAPPSTRWSPPTSRRARSAPATGAPPAWRSALSTPRAASRRVWLDGHGLNPHGEAALARLERADEDGMGKATEVALPHAWIFPPNARLARCDADHRDHKVGSI